MQVHRVRILYLRAVLGQDMTWYDTQTTANFASTMTELGNNCNLLEIMLVLRELHKYQDGIGEKL